MEASAFEDLIAHLGRLLGLERASAARVVDEVVAYFGETVEQFVLRRHGELRAEDRRNEEVFAQILGELERRRFAAPPTSARQLRRLIYG